MTKKRTIDDWLSKGKPEEVEIGVCFRRDLLSEFHRLTVEYDALKAQKRGSKYGEAGGLLDDEDQAEQAARRLAELLEQIKADEAEHTFRFRKMPYAEFRQIIEAHPATEQQKQANPWLDHNPDTAAPFLVAGSCVHPDLTPDDAEKLREFLPEGPWGQLYGATLQVNRTGTTIPKGVRSFVETLAYELRSNSHQLAGSPSPSSEDG